MEVTTPMMSISQEVSNTRMSRSSSLSPAPRLPSYLRGGYTYTAVYVYEEEDENSSGGPADCCRPTKSKCEGKSEKEVCKVNKGKIQCGKDCAKIIAQLQKLEDNQNAESLNNDYSSSPIKKRKKKPGKIRKTNRKIRKRKKHQVSFTFKADSQSKSKAKAKPKSKKTTKAKASTKKKAKAKIEPKKMAKISTKPKEKTKSKLKVESFEEYSLAQKKTMKDSKTKQSSEEDTDDSSSSNSEESFEGYSSEPMKKKTKHGPQTDGKLSNKKLRMLETVSKKQYKSRNPLCKKKRNLFR